MAGVLSSDGKCRAFDKQANGYVRGEGSGAIFLKRLSAAEADGNHIYAVIKATAENHGGRAIALTAPSSSAQSALLIEAYQKAHIDPTTVGYIECHGTGTSLGDPIEIQSLSKAFSELYKTYNKAPAKSPHCGLSSVKTNIGHLETAAGMGSLLKVLLAIKHKQIPANIHFEELNPYINLKGTPFYIADRLTSWDAIVGEDGSTIPRRAGVSGFGFGGANAHIVLEEYIPPQRQSASRAPRPHLIVLSAKNEDRLKAYMQSIYACLEKKEVELDDIAYTLQVGRDEMPERLALVVSNAEELKQKLEELLKDGERPKDSYRNNIGTDEAKSKVMGGAEGEKLVQALIQQEQLSKLAELWVSGTKIDWRLLYNSDLPKRISIPTYPFARQRYWIKAAEQKVTQEHRYQDPISASYLHSQMPGQESILEDDRFASTFSGVQMKAAATDPTLEVAWVFLTGPSVANGNGVQPASMRAEEKMELFLKQEAALQLQRPLDRISTDVTYFDLGLSSLGIVSVIQKINELLHESLPISAVFEYRDIQSLAAYLAATYRSKIDALSAIREKRVLTYSDSQPQINTTKLTPLPIETYLSGGRMPSSHEHTDATTARLERTNGELLDMVRWQEGSLDNSYEKVTF